MMMIKKTTIDCLSLTKDEKGHNQLFRQTPALVARSQNRCSKIRTIANIERHHNVLEIGCGSGEYAKIIHTLTGAKVTGIDISPRFIQMATPSSLPGRIDFLIGDALAPPFENESFDIVFGNGILHHIPDKRTLLYQLRRILKPNGIVVFLEPNLNNPLIFLLYKTFLRNFAHLDPDEEAFTKATAKGWLSENGFNNAYAEPVDFVLPNTPDLLVGLNLWLSDVLEKTPLIREISQSILVSGVKN